MSRGRQPKVNWEDATSVMTFAARLGKGLMVFKHPKYTKYVITHTAYNQHIPCEWIIYQTI